MAAYVIIDGKEITASDVMARARAIVDKMTTSGEVRSWIRMDEKGTFERDAGRLLQTPGLSDLARDKGVDADGVIQQTAEMVILSAMEASLGVAKKRQRKKNPATSPASGASASTTARLIAQRLLRG